MYRPFRILLVDDLVAESLRSYSTDQAAASAFFESLFEMVGDVERSEQNGYAVYVNPGEAGALAIVNYGLTIGDAILITPIASALSIVTIMLAIIFLKDKVTKFQGFGIIVAVAGIIITAF